MLTIILKLDIPAIFIGIISSDWINFKNKRMEEIKKINGKILYIIDGTFKIDINKGNKKSTSRSLKKLISSNKLIIIPNPKNKSVIFNINFEYSIKIYFLSMFVLSISNERDFQI